MNNLYNSLISGSAYTNEAGQSVVTPPTALNLRAAKVLKQIADINDNNVGVITQLQQREQASLIYAELQQQAISNLLREVNELTKEKESYAKNSESNGSENIFADKSGEAA